MILYADDILLYKKLDSDQDHAALQRDVYFLSAKRLYACGIVWLVRMRLGCNV